VLLLDVRLGLMSVQYVKRINPAVRFHPVSELRDLTIRMEWDEPTAHWVVAIPELNGISTYGQTQEEALQMAGELIGGYIEAMQAVGLKLPIGAAAVRRIQKALAS
jgi:predicted RNase H-like HicB family nuclease